METLTTTRRRRLDVPREPRRLAPTELQTDLDSVARPALASSPGQPPRAHRTHRAAGPRSAVKRMLLGGLTALVGVSLVTAGPLFALWVGARFQTEVGLSLATVGVTASVLIVTTFALYKALTRLSAAYDDAVDRTRRRAQPPWHEPASVARRAIAAQQPRSVIDWIVVATTVVAVVTFVIWFFFFA